VRQFRLTDPEGFARESGLAELRTRLAAFEASAAFARVMDPPWAFRQPWRSPRWLYHLALEEDWQAARRQGVYTRSTRGRSLEEEGFIHASWRHQLEPTWRRFYSDDPPLRLLTIDLERLRAAGIAVKEEPAPGSGERFPHIYGPLPLEAVGLALPWEAPTP
jgi:glutathione S-transferase